MADSTPDRPVMYSDSYTYYKYNNYRKEEASGNTTVKLSTTIINIERNVLK